MSDELARARRAQIEGMVERSMGAQISLCDKAHELYQMVGSNSPLIVIRGNEERRVIDNFALIGRVLNKEVYNWSLTSGLYRCNPTVDLIANEIPEPIQMSPEERAASGGLTGLGLLAYYLRDLWQHPLLGAFPERNPTRSANRTGLTEQKSRGSVFVLKDAHLQLTNQPMAVRVLKDLVEAISWQNHHRQKNQDRFDRSLKGMTIVISTSLGWDIPPELRDLATEVNFPRPNADEFRDLMYGSILPPNCDPTLRTRLEEQEPRILHAAIGLTAKSFLDSLKVSGIEQALDSNDPFIIRDEIIAAFKKAAIKAGGAIHYEEPDWSMEDVGGHDALKAYLRDRSVFFDPENPIQDRLPEGVVLPMPKGVLMVGIPGCGKSLEAKAMASMLGVPLLTLDMGSVFTGLVGGSEQRVREALALAEECSPCVMRIEEIEKALSGSGSSNMSDGGTTNRVFQTILNWLQEKTKPVYVVATANDVAQLPPELLRKGRFDEIWFVDLPVLSERVEIFRIHLKKWAGLTDEQIDARFDLDALASRTGNFSGAEIEALIKDALYRAVSEFNLAGEGEFAFEGRHVNSTIGEGDTRTFCVLYDSEHEKLERLRALARSSWANASSFEAETSQAQAEGTVANMPSTRGSIAADFLQG